MSILKFLCPFYVNVEAFFVLVACNNKKALLRSLCYNILSFLSVLYKVYHCEHQMPNSCAPLRAIMYNLIVTSQFCLIEEKLLFALPLT